MRHQHLRWMGRAVLLMLCSGNLFTTGCSLHGGMVTLRYTPLTQTEQLTDTVNPSVVLVRQFTDMRSDPTLMELRMNPVNPYLVKYQSSDDVSELVQRAFTDGLLKAGFDVSLSSPQEDSGGIILDGKVLTFSAASNNKWAFDINMNAHVAVEVSIVSGNRSPVAITIGGSSHFETKEAMNTEDALSILFDHALQDCVKKFLADEHFRAFIQKIQPKSNRQQALRSVVD